MEMSTQVTIRMIATIDNLPQREFTASEVRIQEFCPDVPDRELEHLIEDANKALEKAGIRQPQDCSLEVSLALSSTGGCVRPSLHPSPEVIRRLAVVGAALDFDPYCE